MSARNDDDPPVRGPLIEATRTRRVAGCPYESVRRYLPLPRKMLIPAESPVAS
jgi:hypothetical protein